MVKVDIRLLRRFPVNRSKRDTKGIYMREIYLQQLMANPQLLGVFIERFTPLPPGMDVDGMAMAFTEAMISVTSRHEQCAVKDRGGDVLARERRRKRSGRRGKPRSSYCV